MGLGVLRPLLPDPLGIRAPAGEKCTYFSYSLGGAAVAAPVGRGQWAPLREAVDVVALFPRSLEMTVAPHPGAPVTGLVLCFKAVIPCVETASERVTDLPSVS